VERKDESMSTREAGRMGGEKGGQRGGEASLHSEKVSASEFAMYMKGVNFPASKQQIIQMAKSNGAPENVISFMNRIPEKQYTRVTEVEEEFSKLK